MQESTCRPGLPAIRVMLVVAAVGYVLPLAWIAHVEYQQAERRVGAAEAAHETATRLDALLRVAPALTVERNATGALLAVGRSRNLPDPVRSAIGIDFETETTRARTAVDAVAAEIHDPTLAAAIADVRVAADRAGAEVGEVDASYAALAARLHSIIDDELVTLNTHAVGAGGGAELATAARVAEAAAAVEIEQVGQSTLWTVVTASFDQLTVADVVALSDSLARLDQAMADFEAEVDPRSEAGRIWYDPVRRAEADEHFRAYADDVRTKMTGQLPVVAPPSAVEIGEVSFDDDLLADIVIFVDGILARLDTDARVTDGIGSVVDAALADVGSKSATLAAEATAARDRVMVWIATVSLASILGGFLLAGLLARPVARLARSARAMSAGDLDQRVPVSGPREVRVAARAMNEAIDSLKLAESQAVALAAVRLDDPILQSSVPGTLGRSLQGAVQHLTDTLTEREELRRRLQHEASHDGLTGLLNRNAALAHLASALARAGRVGTGTALLFIDLDGFKSVNDTHGHQVGDRVLQVTASRLLEAIRLGDVAGRLGGDEFVVISEALSDVEGAAALAARVAEECGRPIAVDDGSISPELSIGVAMADGTRPGPDELLRRADVAVYRAKATGGRQIRVWDGQHEPRLERSRPIG